MTDPPSGKDDEPTTPVDRHANPKQTPTLGSRKRARDIQCSASGDRSTKRRRRDCRSSKAHSSPPRSRLDDGTYEPEVPECEAWEAKVFKAKFPNGPKAAQEWLELNKRYGGKAPKDVVREMLKPYIKDYAVALQSKGADVARHFRDLWVMGDQWTYPVDNVFAMQFSELIEQSRPQRSSPALCSQCELIDVSLPIVLSGYKSPIDCALCAMLSRDPAHVGCETELSLLDRRSLVRICATTETRPVLSGLDLQIGFPVLPGWKDRFRVLREWLRICDRDHQNYNCYPGSASLLPTRVLDVGDGKLRLHVSQQDERGDYIALSHCWGALTEEQKRSFCTSSDNIDSRCSYQGFDVATLPKTFQDAVTVTRELGKRFLWIDSLCIIQYGDFLKDWSTESQKMGCVFGNAYCTIAATSAQDATAGFLGLPPVQDPEPQCVKIENSPHGPLYISKLVDDFNGDVEEGALNRRAWVLQERALSRRTIHFTTNQTYWECGEGVRCGTLTRMRNSKALFLSDPQFPMSLIHRRTKAKIELFQSLFSSYSRLGITKHTDRPVAIAGLVDRIATTFQTTATHGVFEQYLQRSLIWQRAEPGRLQKISYPPGRKVPTWSWMAYTGEIEYAKTEDMDVEWSGGIQLIAGLLHVRVRRLRSSACRILPNEQGVCGVEGLAKMDKKGWIRFDGADHVKTRTLRCVVVGRSMNNPPERKYIILVLTPSYSKGQVVFERVGLGIVSEDVLNLEGEAVTAHMI